METIYRYELPEAYNQVQMPAHAQVLNVGISNDPVEGEVISLWARINTDEGLTTRTFLIFGTGANMDNLKTYHSNYIGTVQRKNQFAFHIFEVFE